MAERHFKQGFQTTVKNDLYMVEEQLQAYDPHLYIMYNPQSNVWLIMDGLIDVAIMKIPQKGFETLDSRVVSHIKRIHTANGFSAVKEVQKADRALEKEYERLREDIAENFAKDSLRAVKNVAYGYV